MIFSKNKNIPQQTKPLFWLFYILSTRLFKAKRTATETWVIRPKFVINISPNYSRSKRNVTDKQGEKPIYNPKGRVT